MEIYMTPKRCGVWKKKCSFSGDQSFEGEVIYSPFLRKRVTLLQGGESVLSIRQANILEWLIFAPSKLFLPFPYQRPRYHVFTTAGEVGASVVKFQWKDIMFVIQGSTYVLRQHSHNIGSLTKNECQIARYEWRVHEPLSILYASETQLKLILAFALLYYGLCHAENPRWHDTIFFNDEYGHLAHWSVESDKNF